VSVIVLTSLLATGFAAKVAYETCTSQTLFVDSSPLAEVPEPLAHAVGFAIGLAVASVGTIGQRPPSRPSVGHRNPPPESP
jgi:hypothetical protein